MVDLVADEELRAHVKLTGDQQFKQQMKGVGDSADKAGDQIDDLAGETGHLAKEAAKAEVEVKRLIEAINETGDLTLLKALRKEKRQLRLFEGLKKELEAELQQVAVDVASPAGGAGNAGGVIGEGIAKGIGAAIAAGGPAVWAPLAVVGASLTPLIGGIIASAVIGAVGLGGIAGGLAAASQDPRVKTAAEELGGVAMTAFGRAAEPFVAPAIEALDLLGRAATDVANTMKPAFASLAPVLIPFTQGIVGLVEEMMPGLVKGMEAAKPVLRAIANELPEIGAAFGDFIGAMSEDTDGAIMAFATLSDAIQITLRWTGGLIAALSDAFEWTVRTADKVNTLLVDLFGWVPKLGEILENNDLQIDELIGDLERSGDASGDFKGKLGGVGDAAKDAAAEIEAMRQALDRAFGIEMDIEQAIIAYERSIDDLTESVKENGKTLDERDEKGRANRGAILDEIQAIKDLRDANIANGASVYEANSAYDKQIEALRQSAIKLGLNKDQVNQLVGAFKDIPHDIEVEIRAPGLLAALANARELIRLLGSRAAAAAANNGEYISGRASGGPVMAGQTYVVGENGPEVLQMGAQSGMVYNASQTAAMMSGGSATSTVNLVVSVKPGADGPLMAAIISNLQFEVQTTGEGSADRYFAGV